MYTQFNLIRNGQIRYSKFLGNHYIICFQSVNLSDTLHRIGGFDSIPNLAMNYNYFPSRNKKKMEKFYAILAKLTIKDSSI